MHHFFTLERTLFGEWSTVYRYLKGSFASNVVKLPLMKSILFYSILAIKWRKS